MINRFILGAAMLFAVVAPVSANAEIEDFEGYQGFVDIGYTFGTGDYGLNSVDVVTSHGVQIIPTYLFTGIGTGIQYFHEVKKMCHTTVCRCPHLHDRRRKCKSVR